MASQTSNPWREIVKNITVVDTVAALAAFVYKGGTSKTDKNVKG
jgi:hypothetical protein